jgi:hypothetical protein
LFLALIKKSLLDFWWGKIIPPAICGIRAQSVSDTPPSAGVHLPTKKGKTVPRNAPGKTRNCGSFEILFRTGSLDPEYLYFTFFKNYFSNYWG